jgi:hypothetical protein
MTDIRWSRVREIAFGLCTAWLVVQNAALFMLLPWHPIAMLRTALLAIAHHMFHGPGNATLFPSAALLGLACVLPLARALGDGVSRIRRSSHD